MMNAMDVAHHREQLVRTIRLRLLTGETISEADDLEKTLWTVLKAYDNRIKDK